MGRSAAVGPVRIVTRAEFTGEAAFFIPDGVTHIVVDAQGRAIKATHNESDAEKWIAQQEFQ